jgi:WD40 repeat protein
MRGLTSSFLLLCPLLTLAAGGAARAAAVTEVATLATPAHAGSVVLAKTGRLAAADCADGKLRLWSIPDGRLQREIDLARRHIDALALTADGSRIAAADHGGAFTIWDTSTGATLAQLQMPFYPSAMAFSHDDRTLAIAATGDSVQLINAGSGRKLLELQRPVGGTTAVTFSRDDRRIGTADADTVVRIYDARSGALLAQNANFLLEPLAVDFSADGRQLLAAGADEIIAAVDTSSGNVIRKSAKAVDPVAYLEVSADGRLLAAALMHAANLTSPAPIVISDMASGRTVQEWLPGSLFYGGTWTTDGRLLVATASEKALHIWRVR